MSTTPSYVPPIYEEFSPHIETKELPGFHILRVHIPAGFARDQIGAKVEYDYGRVRVYGERPLEKNKRGRFNVIHQVPGNCDVNRIKGHYGGGIVTVTMAKKDISSEVPPQEELEPTQPEEPPEPPTEPYPEEKDQQEESNIPPKSTPQVEQEKSTPVEVEAPKGKEDISEDSESSEEQADDGETSTATNVTDKSMAEEGQEGISEEPKSTIQSKEQVDETLTPPEAKEVSVPQKGQEGIPQKATFTTDAKHQTEDKFIAGPSAEDGVEKQQSVGKKATEEEEEERKVSAIVDKSFVPKTTEKKVKEKEISGEIGEGIHRKVITDSGGKKIKQVAASASQAVTSLAKRFNINEEDKQKLIYMGAAVIVVALGVYASYKLRSSRRL